MARERAVQALSRAGQGKRGTREMDRKNQLSLKAFSFGPW